jgi:hypothetical protein
MTYFEVLVEGGSDVPVVREVLMRKFGLQEGVDFRIHPHKGRGRLPDNPLAQPDRHQQTLLHQLPAKLRGFSYLGDDVCVLVLVDADDTPCTELLAQLNAMLVSLPHKPARVMFRLAIEETESWFIADENALRQAYPKAKLKLQKLREIPPDAVVGAWERLAEAIGMRVSDITGRDKFIWATAIAPYMDLENPNSPSFRKLLEGVAREVGRKDHPD